MNNVRSLRHTVWECKYDVVWVRKYRRKVLYGEIRRYLGEVIRDLAAQKECRVEEGHLRSDHVHTLISIPPKHSVAQTVGFIKGKSAIHIARNYLGRRLGRTSPGSISGQEATGSPPLARMNRRFGSISRTRSGRTGVSTSSTFSGNRHL